MTLAFSQACENNKQPILDVLKDAFSQSTNLLEIGSGTGQHAVYLSKHLPHLNWQTSDLIVNHPSINQRIDNQEHQNIYRPITLDLNTPWQTLLFDNKQVQLDAVFTANTLHIVSWELVERFFQGVRSHLAIGGTLCIYGPFNYQGRYTSESNAEFDIWLKQRDENSAIRDFEAIIDLAELANLTLVNDHDMPANNRLLEFTKYT